MKMMRRVEPEWLDELPPGDPVAARSRRDLIRVNALMGNAGIVARELRHCFSEAKPRAIAEIGAGDGTLMLRLAEVFARSWKDAQVFLLDRQDSVCRDNLGGLTTLGWNAQPVTADVFEWLAQPSCGTFDLIIANLFLHHFDGARLRSLLSLIAARTRTFIACEPRRSGLALGCSRMLGCLGCNEVIRHDAQISVRAGFNGEELSALWPGAWSLRERSAGMFSHCFVACRTGAFAPADDGT